jgi:hypothetical protein
MHIKYNNKQTKQTKNKQKLSPKKTNISNNSIKIKIFSKNKHIHIKTKQTYKNLCISNSKKKSKQHKQCIKSGLIKNKRSHTITSSNSPNSENITEISRRRKNNYFNSALMKKPNMVKLIKKPDYFDYTPGEIRKRLDKGEGYEKARPSTPTRIIKCSLIKKCILWLHNKTLRIFNPYEKGKGEYCGPRDLPTLTLEKLNLIKHPYFLLLQEMFFYRGVSMIDAYLHRISETTLKSYRSGWKIFVYFLIIGKRKL